MRGKFGIVVTLLQVIFILIYAFVVEYGDDLDAGNPIHNKDPQKGGQDPKDNSLSRYYPMFQDINAMIFIGVGLLYAFLRKYGYMGMGMNLLIAAISMEWSIITKNVWDMKNGKIKIDIFSLVKGEFAAASAVIALGAIFGKVNPLQIVIFTVIEVFFYTTSEYCTSTFLEVSDIGGSVSLHLFAAVFGCIAAYVLDRNVKVQENPNEGSSYNSNIFCLIGTVLLWAFWPSFNAAEAIGDRQHRTVINTHLAFIGSCLTAFATSSYLNKDNKFSTSHIQNAVLAGGVAVGAVADLMIQPYGALLIGAIGGIISVLGFKYFTPFLSKINVHDPCGINSLHGIPGLFSGLCSIAVVLMANEEFYGFNLYKLYPAMSPQVNTTAYWEIKEHLSDIAPGIGRSREMQAFYQLIYILITIAFALLTGSITGLLLRLKIFDPLEDKHMYLDDVFWEVPEVKET